MIFSFVCGRVRISYVWVVGSVSVGIVCVMVKVVMRVSFVSMIIFSVFVFLGFFVMIEDVVLWVSVCVSLVG